MCLCQMINVMYVYGFISSKCKGWRQCKIVNWYYTVGRFISTVYMGLLQLYMWVYVN